MSEYNDPDPGASNVLVTEVVRKYNDPEHIATATVCFGECDFHGV